MFALWERVKDVSESWIKTGHVDGSNTHNVSASLSVKDDEWDAVGDWMWKNRDYYNGLAVFPFDGGNYKQPVFEDISESTFYRLRKTLTEIDLTQVHENGDDTDLSGELACAGN